eukprot:218222_1
MSSHREFESTMQFGRAEAAKQRERNNIEYRKKQRKRNLPTIQIDSIQKQLITQQIYPAFIHFIYHNNHNLWEDTAIFNISLSAKILPSLQSTFTNLQIKDAKQLRQYYSNNITKNQQKLVEQLSTIREFIEYGEMKHINHKIFKNVLSLMKLINNNNEIFKLSDMISKLKKHLNQNYDYGLLITSIVYGMNNKHLITFNGYSKKQRNEFYENPFFYMNPNPKHNTFGIQLQYLLNSYTLYVKYFKYFGALPREEYDTYNIATNIVLIKKEYDNKSYKIDDEIPKHGNVFFGANGSITLVPSRNEIKLRSDIKKLQKQINDIETQMYQNQQNNNSNANNTNNINENINSNITILKVKQMTNQQALKQKQQELSEQINQSIVHFHNIYKRQRTKCSESYQVGDILAVMPNPYSKNHISFMICSSVIGEGGSSTICEVTMINQLYYNNCNNNNNNNKINNKNNNKIYNHFVIGKICKNIGKKEQIQREYENMKILKDAQIHGTSELAFEEMECNYIELQGYSVLFLKYDPSAIPLNILTEMKYNFMCRKIIYYIGYSLCLILSALHRRGIIHCDLKLQNIIMIKNNDYQLLDVKIIDFGEARIIRDGDTSVTVNTPYPVGTAGSIAEEIYTERKIYCASDIFSLGVVIAQLIINGRPKPKILKSQYKNIKQFNAIKDGLIDKMRVNGFKCCKLISNMLQFNHIQRPTANDAANVFKNILNDNT